MFPFIKWEIVGKEETTAHKVEPIIPTHRMLACEWECVLKCEWKFIGIGSMAASFLYIDRALITINKCVYFFLKKLFFLFSMQTHSMLLLFYKQMGNKMMVHITSHLSLSLCNTIKMQKGEWTTTAAAATTADWYLSWQCNFVWWAMSCIIIYYIQI